MNPRSLPAFKLVVIVASVFASISLASAQDKLIYSNDWFPSGDKGIQFYAKHKGYFAKEGLDVTFITARGSSDSITRLASGSADVGSGSMVALLQAKVESNIPVKTAVSFYNKPADSIMVAEGSKIKSLKDLDGSRLATATFASSNVFWPQIVKALKLDESKITLIKVDPAAMTPMLAAGQVDGIVSWLTSASTNVQALKEVNKKLKILPWSDIGFEGYSYSAIISDKLIQERPDVARRFVRAIRAAGEAALKDPKGVGQSIKALYPDVDEALMVEQFSDALVLMDNEISKAEGFGTIDKKRLNSTWEWVAKSQGYDVKRIDPQSIVALDSVMK
jgi:NitT/TauT family transport system substrate-binding protein